MTAHTLKFKTTKDFLKYIKDNDIQFVDMNFTDLRGKWQHTTEHAAGLDEYKLDRGIFFDGSSIAGWQPINNSDMIIMPDLGKVSYDPFAAQKTLKVFCDIHNAEDGKPYKLDPRSIAKSAEKYLASSGMADTAYFGPEAEFFIFDDVKIHMDMNKVGFEVDSEEGPYNSGRDYDTGKGPVSSDFSNDFAPS
ncbi:MAG: glutamine synthetase beta-grasp domain-containing protein [Alphaproteobacteria bacterium]|nr:glutamine synthetase beta-grasp domain-containing protein [Alphaproteobacteria bacterium]